MADSRSVVWGGGILCSHNPLATGDFPPHTLVHTVYASKGPSPSNFHALNNSREHNYILAFQAQELIASCRGVVHCLESQPCRTLEI